MNTPLSGEMFQQEKGRLVSGPELYVNENTEQLYHIEGGGVMGALAHSHIDSESQDSN